jgi:hypothetical protein
MSSVSVMSNALLLRRWRPEEGQIVIPGEPKDKLLPGFPKA